MYLVVVVLYIRSMPAQLHVSSSFILLRLSVIIRQEHMFIDKNTYFSCYIINYLRKQIVSNLMRYTSHSTHTPPSHIIIVWRKTLGARRPLCAAV